LPSRKVAEVAYKVRLVKSFSSLQIIALALESMLNMAVLEGYMLGARLERGAGQHMEGPRIEVVEIERPGGTGKSQTRGGLGEVKK